jgi:hypothetical protein
MSLDSLLSRGGSVLCWSGGASFGCGAGHTTASARNGQVVLSMTDAATIRLLFALRPAIVHVWHERPGEPNRFMSDSAMVEYVSPQIPQPNAALLAESDRLRREATTPKKWTYRVIDGGARAFGPLWLVAGDSADLGIREVRCLDDVCYRTEFDSRSTWTVDDTTIVALRTVLADSLRIFRETKVPDTEIVLLLRTSATAGVVTARRPGRTTLRVTLPVPGYEGPPSSHWPTTPVLEREVIVSPVADRIGLSAPQDTIRAGERVEFRALAFDRAGAVIAGAPVEVRRVAPLARTIANDDGWAGFTFDSAGSYTLVATFGGKTATITVTVADRRAP